MTKVISKLKIFLFSFTCYLMFHLQFSATIVDVFDFISAQCFQLLITYIQQNSKSVVTFQLYHQKRPLPYCLSFLRNISQSDVSGNTRIYIKSGTRHAFRYSGFPAFRSNVFKILKHTRSFKCRLSEPIDTVAC